MNSNIQNSAKNLNMKHMIYHRMLKIFGGYEKLIKLRGQPLTIPNEISHISYVD